MTGTGPDMFVDNALASLAVADLDGVQPWYEQILGPGTRVMETVAEWRFPNGGGLQVYVGPERAGRGSCTLVVADVDHVVAHLHDTGVAPDATAVHHDRVDTVMIKDPDGNSIAFAHAKDDTLAR